MQRILFLMLIAAHVAFAADGDQRNRGQAQGQGQGQSQGQPQRQPQGQPMRGPSIQVAPPAQPVRTVPQRGQARIQERGQSRGQPVIQSRGVPQNVPQSVQKGGFDATPSMSRTPRSRQIQAQQRGEAAAKQQIQTFMQTRARTRNVRQTPQSQQAARQAIPRQIETRRQAAANVQTRIKRYRPNYTNAFNDTFWKRHNYRPAYYRSGYDWWRPYPWVTINNFLNWGWSYPVYFSDAGYPVQIAPDYGAGYPVQMAPEEVAPQAVEGDWLSLGVFAAARSEDEAAYSPMFVQLAVDKEGELAGTYYNVSKDEVHPLNGIVDRDSQQAVWKVSDNPDSPIMTTGIYNLTQDVADVQVHFSDGSEQLWVLVRLRA